LAAGSIILWPRLIAGRLAAHTPPERVVSVVTLYSTCGHSAPDGRANPAAVTNLENGPVGARFGDWRLLDRSGRRLRLAYEVDGLCPVCRKSRFLGVHDGLVAIYAGIPGRRGEVLEVTRIPAEALPRAELADLEQGIAFKDNRERLQLLEGLASLVNE